MSLPHPIITYIVELADGGMLRYPVSSFFDIMEKVLNLVVKVAYTQNAIWRKWKNSSNFVVKLVHNETDSVIVAGAKDRPK